MPLFGPKERSPKKCSNCKAMVQFGPYMDIATCICGEQFRTGYEPELRMVVEKNYAGTPYPPYAVGRAIGHHAQMRGREVRSGSLCRCVHADRLRAFSTADLDLLRSMRSGKPIIPCNGGMRQTEASGGVRR